MKKNKYFNCNLRIYKASKLAEFIGVSRRTIYNWIKKGRLPVMVNYKTNDKQINVKEKIKEFKKNV